MGTIATSHQERATGAAIRALSRVACWMTPHAIALDAYESAGTAEQLAEAAQVCHLPVLDGGDLIGMVCVCDLWGKSREAPVRAVMSTPVVTVSAHASLAEARRLMEQRGIGALPVLAGDRMCGIITWGDLMRAGAVPARRACRACGSRHHVRNGFCRDCNPPRCPVELRDAYEDLGGGD